MYGRTTILAVVPALLCLLACPLEGNQRYNLHSACKATSLEYATADFQVKKNKQRSPYLLVSGKVFTEDGSRLPGGYFHLDVYQSSVGGKKMLIRTSRFQGDTYQVYLNRGFDHTLIFKVENFPYFELPISAEQTRVSDKGMVLDVTLPAVVADEPITSAPKAEAIPEAKETALLPTQASTTKTKAVVPTAPAPPVREAVLTLPPEEPKQRRAGEATSVLAAYSGLIPLYEDFGGTGEVLEEITDRHLMKVLEQTTSQWWMVAYKSEIGWVNAQQIK